MRSRMKWKALRLCRYQIIVGVDLTDETLCIATSYIVSGVMKVMRTELYARGKNV